MDTIINFLVWLDESNIAYVLMIICFLAMAALHYVQSKENTRLRKLLKLAMR